VNSKYSLAKFSQVLETSKGKLLFIRSYLNCWQEIKALRLSYLLLKSLYSVIISFFMPKKISKVSGENYQPIALCKDC
jgi:hypothetical protein